MYTSIIIYFCISLFFSFLCSLWESVLLSISPSYLQIKQNEEGKTGEVLEGFKDNIDRPLAGILTLNTIAHTVGALGVGKEAAKIWSETDPFISTVVVPVLMTAAILILSEIIPKTIGATRWKALAPFTINSLDLLLKVLAPVIWILQQITKVFNPGKKEHVFSRSDFLAMAQIGSKEGHLSKAETDLIQNLMHFKKFKAKDVMTPRTVLLTAPEDMTLAQFHEIHPELSFSRIPLRAGVEDEAIVGYTLKDEVLENLVQGEGEKLLQAVKREIITVEEDCGLFYLFNNFVERREHIAVVLDKFGGVSGIVTMEDIMETLLGAEIVDETDHTVDMQDLAKQRWKESTSGDSLH